MIAFPTKVSQELKISSSTFKDYKRVELFSEKMCFVLDDVPENTFVVRKFLKKAGMKVIAFNNAIDAIECYKRYQKLDVIITDLRMPSMSGQQFILEVRKLEKSRDMIPACIVVVTAENSQEERRLCLTEYGANDYLIKPINSHDLVASIMKVLSKAQAKEEIKNILIIEDDPISGSFLFETLRKNGYSCELVVSLEAGKKTILESLRKYNVILLDSLLGDGSGLEFLEFLTGLNEAIPPIISMSGNTIEDQKEMYKEYKLNGFFQKPIKKKDLIGYLSAL